MAEPATLARPYARAAFEVARSEGKLADWMDGLALSAQVSRAPRVMTLIHSPSHTAEQKSAALADLMGERLNPGLRNLLRVLADNDRLILLPEIAVLFEQMKMQAEQSVDVTITSAFPVDVTLQENLTTALKRKLQRDVILSTKVDEALLGGAIIRAGDTVIDGSIKGRLSRLAEALGAQ